MTSPRGSRTTLTIVSSILLATTVLSPLTILARPGVAYGGASCTILARAVVICTTGGEGHNPTPTTTTIPTQPGPPSQTPPYYYTEVPCYECVEYQNDYVCQNDHLVDDPRVGDWAPPAPLPPGDSVPWSLEKVVVTTGEVTGLGLLCGSPPPSPPSPSGAWAAAVKYLPVPLIESNPAQSGLVQLQTWFWLGNDPVGVPVIVTAAADGGSVTATVYPESYTWNFGPPGAVPVTSYTGGAPGSASSASAVYTYMDKGTYEVTVSVNWTGSYTFDGGTPIALPTVSQEQGFPYEVREIRSVLRGSS